MPNSLLTGVSGLVSHQRMLDIVGHNIANANTHGFKSQRILFADSLYESVSPASSGGDEGTGGINPTQIGGGVKIASTDRKFTQGTIDNTGNALDFAFSGDGFFTVSDGTSQFYTRAGAFSLDGDGFLVSPQGMYVQRFSSVGEPEGTTPGFQVPGDNRIQVPIGAPIQGVITEEMVVTGNLDASAEPPRAQQLTAANPFTAGGANASTATLLNDLDTSTAPFQAGDQILVTGLTHLGADVNASVPVDGTSTIQDLLNAIDAAYPDSSVALVDGRLQMTANDTGSSQLSITLRNETTNQGEIAFPTHRTDVLTGKGPDVQTTLVRFYDEAGGEHEMKLSFEKRTDDEWALVASVDPDSGTMVDAEISPIEFSDSGILTNVGDPSVTVQIAGIARPQTIALSFGDADDARRLTHFDTKASLTPDSDGSAPGVLTGMKVEQNGAVLGIASNGKTFDLAQLSIALFRNNQGLDAEADNLYRETTNSGQAEIGFAGAGGRGIIRGSQLEASNVDMALEFTKLIIAQRGYSANARTITVSDEMLEELTNIIR